MITLHSIVILLHVSITVRTEEPFVEPLGTSNSDDININTCRRNCQVGAPPMLCRYNFEIELYHTLTEACRNCPYNITDCFLEGCVTGDGTKRGIVTINKQLPGPAIEVCQNDIVTVDVTNKMSTDATTIHWHGQLQKSCPYMDGVPHITQCPIHPYNSFRYTFKASQAGTHFWHSHMGMQRVDGAFGPLIVRVPKEKDYHNRLYDFDLPSHTIVINDWAPDEGANILLSHFYAATPTTPRSILVNGFGRYRNFERGYQEVLMPTPKFKVDRGYRYRFRIINSGGFNCPIEVTVDNHNIDVISTDGLDIKPIHATSILTYAGERFDFILNANQTEDLYWIKFKGLIKCNQNYGSVFQVAVLEYSGINAPPDSYPEGNINYFNSHNNGLQVNPLNKGIESDNNVVPAPRMKAVKSWDESLKEIPDFKYYIGFDFNNITENHFLYDHHNFFNRKSPMNILIPQFNHISMLMPSVALLPQRESLQDTMFCNNESVREKNCSKIHCECLHLIKIPLDSVVEFVLVDEGQSFEGSHPIHLHGYNFRVVAMERIGSTVTVKQVKQKDDGGRIIRNLVDAPLKDTVTVPDGGYTIVRFVASNPGYWILHCHIEVHMALGMAMILQVGEKEQMAPVPKDFPKCGHYVPDVLDSIAYIQQNAEQMIQSNLIILLSLTLYVII